MACALAEVFSSFVLSARTDAFPVPRMSASQNPLAERTVGSRQLKGKVKVLACENIHIVL
jgi:hypothetical protein